MKNSTKQTLSIYLKFALENRMLGFVVLVSVIGATLVGTIEPVFFKKFFDLISNATDRSAVWPQIVNILMIVALIEVARWSFWRICGYTNIRFQPKVMSKLSNLCFSELHKRSFSYFNNNFGGSLVKRVNWFTRAFESIADQFTYNLVPLVTGLVVIFYVLSRRNVYIFLGIAVWLVVFMLVNWLFVKHKIKYDILRSEAESKSTAILADTITNNQNVKLLVGYERELENFEDSTENVRKLREKAWGLEALFDSIQGFLVMALEMGILVLAVILWKNGNLTIGDFVLIQAYLGLIFERIWGFGKVVRNIYTSLADAEEMTVLLNSPLEIVDKPGAKPIQINTGKIEFIKVGFNYHETRKVVQNFNLDIAPKEKIALVGSSGSGKTTIIKLLLRMHDLTEGRIEIDGTSVADVTQTSLWSNISLVPQDPILFHRSLLENIRYGRPDATDEEVVEAAKLARCHEFIDSLPEKYSTFVGERGIKLSGGERQRVAIARAVLRNAPILVLDEATSSLDSESEALIQDALASLMKNKTVIVIAHRLSTIMKMDRIIVMDSGKIIEEGSHQELLKIANGAYQNLWKIQAGGFITSADELEAESLASSQNDPV